MMPLVASLDEDKQELGPSDGDIRYPQECPENLVAEEDAVLGPFCLEGSSD